MAWLGGDKHRMPASTKECQASGRQEEKDEEEDEKERVMYLPLATPAVVGMRLTSIIIRGFGGQRQHSSG